jgi:hypothetical protein
LGSEVFYNPVLPKDAKKLRPEWTFKHYKIHTHGIWIQVLVDMDKDD